jgi:T5orf172 domain
VVYFFKCNENGAIKIGYSHDPKQRLRTLRAEFQWDIVPLAVIPGTRVEEKEIHERFRRDFVGCEWFRPSESLMAYIATLPPAQFSIKKGEGRKPGPKNWKNVRPPAWTFWLTRDPHAEP